MEGEAHAVKTLKRALSDEEQEVDQKKAAIDEEEKAVEAREAADTKVEKALKEEQDELERKEERFTMAIPKERALVSALEQVKGSLSASQQKVVDQQREV